MLILSKNIGQLPVRYSRFGSRFISVYNEYLKRWDIAMEFINKEERDTYWEVLYES